MQFGCDELYAQADKAIAGYRQVTCDGDILGTANFKRHNNKSFSKNIRSIGCKADFYNFCCCLRLQSDFEMGGGHHQEKLTIPDWKSFKVEDAPDLVKLQKKLAAHGLKDPWLRNYVWLYHKSHQPNWFDKRYWGGVPRYGFRIGLAAAILTTVAGHYLSDDHHGHGDGHGDGHGHSEGHH